MTVQTCPDPVELSGFAIGNLSRAAFARVADHVQRCADCEKALQALEDEGDALVTRLRQSSYQDPFVDPALQKLVTAVRTFRFQENKPSWLDTEGQRRVGKFLLLEELGLGSFGHVFRARDTELDRTVAIKIPRAGRLAGREDVDRFFREARSAAQLKHPGVVAIYDIGQVPDGTCYLVEEFIQGETLAARLNTERFDFRRAAEFVAQVAEALDYAHQHGVVHRDVKPSNIMVDPEGRPHVMDFGLAKREADETPMTLDGQVLGTPAYMSPEQARGEAHHVDARSDIYSLGVILYELTTGERPFRGNRRMLILQVLQDEPRPPRQLNDKMPRDLETICLKAMAKAPLRRYASARELADDLRRFLAGEPIQARPVGWLERGWNWARRRPAVAALVAVSLLAAALLVSVLSIAYVQSAREQQRTQEALVEKTQALDALRSEQRKTSEALERETKAKEELLKALLQNARLTSDAVREFNTLYASEVVARVDPKVPVTHDYASRKGAIPLPATMSVELGKRIAARGSGMQIRLYSDYPYPWRKQEGGPKDDFEREALVQLRQKPEEPFYRFEDYNGRTSLRYATASRLEASCLDCHNKLPYSPKQDWKAGDVRGVYEVIFPVDRGTAEPKR